MKWHFLILQFSLYGLMFFISNSHNIQFDMYSKFLNRFSKFINGELSTILSTITVTDC